VIATGYGDGRPRVRQHARAEAGEDARQLREPAGEPRVSRVRQRSGSFELDVPEFIPRR